MPKYLITDETGEVVRLQETEQGEPGLLPGEQMFLYESEVAPPWQRDRSKILKYIDGEFLIVDTRDLAAMKAAKNEQINAWRLAANQSYFVFNGKQIACDNLSRGDIDGVTSEVSVTGALPETFPGAWKAMDNTYVPIPDVPTWVSLIKAMVAQGTANFIKAQTLKAQLAAATTVAEVDAITWQ